jgi:hypothetical protein
VAPAVSQMAKAMTGWELAELKLTDVDTEERLLRVVKGKGSSTVPAHRLGAHLPHTGCSEDGHRNNLRNDVPTVGRSAFSCGGRWLSNPMEVVWSARI